MKNSKKEAALILGLAAVIAVAAAVLTCVLLMPKLRMGNRLKELLKENYTYSAEVSVEGMDFGLLGDSLEGELAGSHSADVIYAGVSYKGFEYLEAYVSADGKVMLNVEKLFESAIARAEEKTGIPLDFMKSRLTDLTISSDQIEDITGVKLVTMADAGVTQNSLQEFIQAVKLLSAVKQVKADDMAAAYPPHVLQTITGKYHHQSYLSPGARFSVTAPYGHHGILPDLLHNRWIYYQT